MLITSHSIRFGLTVFALIEPIHVFCEFDESALTIGVAVASAVAILSGASVGALVPKSLVGRVGGGIGGAGKNEGKDWA